MSFAARSFKVSSYRLTFYEQRLIEIEYSFDPPLSSTWWEFRGTLVEKFGEPRSYGLDEQQWSNAVSSLRLDKPRSGRSSFTLTMLLKKDSSEYLEKWSKRRKSEAKGDL